MNPLEMRYLGGQLQKSGFQVHYAYYQSVLKTPAENARHIHTKISNLGVNNLHIVAHSLGGLIIMHLFEQFNDVPDGRVVMLGSPVKGSLIAQKFQGWPLISPLIARSMQGALSGENIPAWNSHRDWGMIAGTRNQGLGLIIGGLPNISDGTVMLEETQHPKQKEHISVNSSHTGLLFSKEVAQLTTNFLNTGKFHPKAKNN